MSSEPVSCVVADGLATLRLDRPDKLNALNRLCFEALDRHLRAIEADPSVACVVLRGAGRSFCAGHDLGDIADGREDSEAKRFESGVLERLAALPMPVIAAVHGHCLTGGLELALAADIIVASATARFGDTHSKWDLVPVWGASQRLPRRVGRSKALEMMFSARKYSGAEALAMGLAELCVADDRFDAAVAQLTADILANAPRANRAIKRLLDETEGMTQRAGIAWELHHTAGRGPEMAERIERFRTSPS